MGYDSPLIVPRVIDIKSPAFIVGLLISTCANTHVLFNFKIHA
nr:MAG TPA: hypothetical protein [Caudoviricetes sp.]